MSWETGVAAHRDVWVLEQRSDAGLVEIVTPALKHLIRFDPTDAWFPYFRSIIISYDDSHVLPAMVAGGSIGGAIRKGDGAVIGAGIALVVATLLSQQPKGVPIACNNCSSRYAVHLPIGEPNFRCPVCNRILVLQLAPPVVGVLPSTAG